MDDLFDDLSIFDMFRMEAEEQVDAMQSLLLGLREGEPDEKTLRSLMRGAHSLKGAARIVGLAGAVKLTHAMEERFVQAQGGAHLSSHNVDTMLSANDLLRSLAAVNENEAETWLESQAAAIDGLIAQLEGSEAAERDSTADPAAESDTPEAAFQFEEIDTSASDVEGESDVEPVEVSPQTAFVDRRKHATPLAQPLPSEPVHEPAAPETGANAAQANLRITAQRFDRILGSASDMLVKAQTLVRLRERVQGISEQFDRLLRDLVETRQFTERQLETLASALQAQADSQSLLVDLERAASETERTAEELHHDILQARLRPFGEIVPSLRRLIRDLSAEMGKRVRVEITGERTEVDRDILDRLRAPVEHLVRNALDHGLETPAERTAAGKQPEGTLRIFARHENGKLAITLSDDGHGVNVSAVLERAQKRNLVSASVGSRLGEQEILEFLFLPGFSTRDVVTEISGRGFGLDVVQSLVHEVGGAVRIESKAGEGTMFHLTLPVTRSLMRVLIVEQEGETYAVPLVRIARVAQGMVAFDESGSPIVHFENGSMAVLPLIDVLGSGGGSMATGTSTLLCLVDTNGSEATLALQVDRVIGDATVAVRQLAARFGKMAGIAAVTLTEQGAPLLIVDPDSLLRSAMKLQQQRSRTAAGPAMDNRGRVLVVDDSPTVRQMLRRTLLRAGYAVTVGAHGAEGWGLLQVEQFDLLVSDVDMPEMNGIELVEQVRLNARIGSMPIILLSYKGRDLDRQRGLEAGADAYVTKGEFEEASFLQLVEDLIGPAHLPSPAVGWHDEEDGGEPA